MQHAIGADVRVLITVDARYPVPPSRYGGTERIAGLLADGLLKRSHEVALMAASGSSTAARLIPHKSPGKSFGSRAFRKLVFAGTSLRLAVTADIVQNFGRLDYLVGVLRCTRVPLVARFANPIRLSEMEWLHEQRQSGIEAVSVSNDQRLDVEHIGRWTTIYNGVNTEVFRPGVIAAHPESRYLAYLGLISPEKGADVAVEVALRTGHPLKVAGIVPTHCKNFFDRAIRPVLGSQIEFVGELNDQQKVPFLRGAAAMLFPIRRREPCANVLIEALACGTPVLAFAQGCVPEIIDDRIGCVVQSVEEMADAVGRIDSIDRNECRRVAVERFSAERMVSDYCRLYERMLS